MRQAGAADVDILLVPSSDWDSVAAWHAQQAPFRAVENGVAMVRPTRQGISLATDGQGRLLGHKADYFVADEQTLVVSVPTQGSDTLYASFGDAFAYCQRGRAAGPRQAPHSTRSDTGRTGRSSKDEPMAEHTTVISDLLPARP